MLIKRIIVATLLLGSVFSWGQESREVGELRSSRVTEVARRVEEAGAERPDFSKGLKKPLIYVEASYDSLNIAVFGEPNRSQYRLEQQLKEVIKGLGLLDAELETGVTETGSFVGISLERRLDYGFWESRGEVPIGAIVSRLPRESFQADQLIVVSRGDRQKVAWNGQVLAKSKALRLSEIRAGDKVEYFSYRTWVGFLALATMVFSFALCSIICYLATIRYLWFRIHLTAVMNGGAQGTFHAGHWIFSAFLPSILAYNGIRMIAAEEVSEWSSHAIWILMTLVPLLLICSLFAIVKLYQVGNEPKHTIEGLQAPESRFTLFLYALLGISFALTASVIAVRNDADIYTVPLIMSLIGSTVLMLIADRLVSKLLKV